MIKKNFLILISLFILSCNSFPTKDNRSPASVPRHIVIAVHGILGDDTTWGDLGNILTTHLKAINPNYQPEFYSYHYEKTKGQENTFQYGEVGLNEFLDNVVFKDRPLAADDRISFVAHSQGGLVVSIWYVDTLVAAAKEAGGRYKSDLAKYAKYANQVETIMTLGTPFWGSKLATRYIDPMKFDPSKIINLFNPQEMNEMAFESNTIYKFRRSTIALSREPELKAKMRARIINLAGVFPTDKSKLYYKNPPNNIWYKISKKVLNFIQTNFFRIGFGDDRYESDVAVLVPSSRLKFLYAEDLQEEGEKKISGSDFREADFFSGNEWLLTESVHSPLFPSINVGMAYIPPSCMNVETCTHPTYRYILSAVSGCEKRNDCSSDYEKMITTMRQINRDDEQANEKLSESLKGFTAEIVLRMPDLNYDIEDPRFKNKPGVVFYTPKSNGDIEDPYEKWLFNQKVFYKNVVKYGADKKGRVSISNPLIEVFMGEDIEYLSKFANWKDMDFAGKAHRDIRLHMTGFVRPSEEGKKNMAAYRRTVENGIDIPIEFALPGLEKRAAELRVRPGYSSYLEMQTRYQEKYR